MKKWVISLSVVICILLLAVSCNSLPQQKKTEVIVIGTYHANTYIMPNFHPDTLRYLMEISKPDVLALELRVEDFVSQNYERVPNDISEIVIPWALKNYIPFEPIDWWTAEGSVERRAFFRSLRETEEGRKKLENSPDESEVYSDKADSFIDLTVEYIHSQEFAQRTKEFWIKLTDYFGEGPGNSTWNTRAAKMNVLLGDVIERHPGKRIVIVTGSAHRYHFEDYASQRDDVDLIPLSQVPGFNDLPEYMGGAGLDEFRKCLSQLVQGPVANSDPDLINVEYIEKLLERYKSIAETKPNETAYISTIAAECDYLKRDYASALEKFRMVAAIPEAAEDTINWAPLSDWAEFRIGQMLDLLGRREEAVQAYKAILEKPEHSMRNGAARYIEKPKKRQ